MSIEWGERNYSDRSDAARVRALWECPTCSRDFAIPVSWEPYGDTDWRLLLRCSSCSATLDLIASSAEVDALCRRIDRDRFRLGLDAARLRSKRLAKEIDVFVIALKRDLICADDFAR
jgi:hypothetical protein